MVRLGIVNFKYKDDAFCLVKSKKPLHGVRINGVTYDVVGKVKDEKMDEVCKLLDPILLETVKSEDDLKGRISSLSGFSISSKKTDDIHKEHLRGGDRVTPPPLKRRATELQFEPQKRELSEEEEIANRSGEMWECVDRIAVPDSVGYDYVFRLKDEYMTASDVIITDAVRAKVEEIFPAVEPFENMLGPSLMHLTCLEKAQGDKAKLLNEFIDADSHVPGFHQKQTDPAYQSTYERAVRLSVQADLLERAGYKIEHKDDGVYLYLPDREALLARWEKMRETTPELPRIKIVPSEGVADDLAYIEAFLSSDALLSNGKEFVHDSTVHVMGLIRLVGDMISAPGIKQPLKYEAEKLKMVKSVAAFYRRLIILKNEFNDPHLKMPEDKLKLFNEQFDKLQMGLAAVVDDIAAIDSSDLYQLKMDSKQIENGFKQV